MGECSTQPLLTVIIPVYKAVETLGPCLESILSQGVQALQVVLIVDGSPDESGLLCDEWAKKDGRIQVIHQPNRGASAARNAGLAAAKGRYITFVDADDRLLPGLYARALPALEENGLYLFGVEFSDGTVPWPLESARYESLSQLAPQLEKLVVDTGTLAVLYNKIYPARLLQGRRFDERLAINEDLELNLRVLADPALEAIQVDGTPGYWYQPLSPDAHRPAGSRGGDPPGLPGFFTGRRAGRSRAAAPAGGPAHQRVHGAVWAADRPGQGGLWPPAGPAAADLGRQTGPGTAAQAGADGPEPAAGPALSGLLCAEQPGAAGGVLPAEGPAGTIHLKPSIRSVLCPLSASLPASMTQKSACRPAFKAY